MFVYRFFFVKSLLAKVSTLLKYIRESGQAECALMRSKKGHKFDLDTFVIWIEIGFETGTGTSPRPYRPTYPTRLGIVLGL